MTVTELIEELQKFPGHPSVIVEFPDMTTELWEIDNEPFEASVADVEAREGCYVFLNAMGGLQ